MEEGAANEALPKVAECRGDGTWGVEVGGSGGAGGDEEPDGEAGLSVQPLKLLPALIFTQFKCCTHTHTHREQKMFSELLELAL